MRAARLLSIQMLLEARGPMTARTLAEELEVSLRTLYRDVDQLSAAGVPIYAERGRSGGLRLLRGWKPSLGGLSAEEAEVVLLGGLAGPAAELGLGERFASARLKLLAAMPEGMRGQAQRLSSRLHVDPQSWYEEQESTPWLTVVAAAVWEQRFLSMSYRSWTRSSRRVVAPLGLVLKAGRWYFVAAAHISGAMDERSLRSYRVSSVASAELQDQRFERPAGFELARYWGEALRRLEQELFRERARVRASAAGLQRLRALGRPVAQAVARAAVPAPGHSVELELALERGDYAAEQLAHLAPEVEVLQPPELREAVARHLRAALRPYRRAAVR